MNAAATTVPRPNTRDMLAIHQVFRDAFGCSPQLVGSVCNDASGNVETVAAYYANVLALPVLADLPPSLDTQPVGLNRLTLPVNLAGLPALSLPIGEVDDRPVAIQLIAPAYGEELLLSLAAEFEVTVG